MNAAIRDHARVPRTQAFADRATDGRTHIVDPVDSPFVGDQHPLSGNGLAKSKDGHLTPEDILPTPQRMDAGLDAFEEPLSTIRFRHADGSAYPQTINGVTASDWALMPVDPSDLSLGSQWVPLP